jgi:hypothetical protein
MLIACFTRAFWRQPMHRWRKFRPVILREWCGESRLAVVSD